MLRALCVLVAQSCPTLCDPVDCSPPGSSVHGIPQARRLEGAAIPFFGDLLDPGIEPMGSIMLSSLPEESMSLLLSPAQVGGFFTTSATWEAQVAIV